ncbi:MAG: hypothetical protein IKP35_02340 [Alphaproteobacteria bacterium]|nr:hypothetical protein [Alphaproteobacteria bacterium]
MITIEKIEQTLKNLNTPKNKKIIYRTLVVLAVLIVGYRFYSVERENSFKVFNIIRNNMENGTPVEILKMEKTNGVLLEPLTIKNNRAYVSGSRISVFKPGQKIGNCKIVSVSHNIDLDTGMHVIKTSGCQNGLQYVEKEKNGFYVPVSAIHGNAVYVENNGVAQIRETVIEDRDAQNALIKSGIADGDVVILSNVTENEKIKITSK